MTGTSSTKTKNLLREISAEFLATTFMLALGVGSCCSATLSHGAAGNTITIVIGWGLAVGFAVLISGGVSGGHLNPAVSFAFAIIGDLPWIKFVCYSLAQLSGAFLGAALAYGVYYDAIESFDGGFRAIQGQNGTAGLFATYPQPFLTTSGGLINEVFATALLLICVLAIIDKQNVALPAYHLPVMVALVIVAINCTFCYNSGCAMNPARDLGPRLFTSLAGWGAEPFSFRNWNWFWVPIIGPLVGGPIGAYVYKSMISFHFSKQEDTITNKQQKGSQLGDSELITSNVNISGHNKNGGCCSNNRIKVDESMVEKSMENMTSSRH